MRTKLEQTQPFLYYVLTKPHFFVLFSLQLAAMLTIPFWQWFLTKFGKKTAVYIGTSVRLSIPSRMITHKMP